MGAGKSLSEALLFLEHGENITIAFHCSEMASLSDGNSGQSKNLKKVSKLLARASQLTYFVLVLIYRQADKSEARS